MPRGRERTLHARCFAIALGKHRDACSLADIAGLLREKTPARRIKAQYRLIGYVAGWEKPVPIAAEKLTAINYAFAHISDGRIVLDQPGAAEIFSRACMRCTCAIHVAADPRFGRRLGCGWFFRRRADRRVAREVRAERGRADRAQRARRHRSRLGISRACPVRESLIATKTRRISRCCCRRCGSDSTRSASERQRRADAHYLLTAALADGEFTAHHRTRSNPRVPRLDRSDDLRLPQQPDADDGHHAALRRSATSAASERSVERAVRAVPRCRRAGAQDSSSACRSTAARLPTCRRKTTASISHTAATKAIIRGRNSSPTSSIATATRATGTTIGQGAVSVECADAHLRQLRRSAVTGAQGRLSSNRTALGGMMYWEQSQDPDGELLDVLASGLR